MKAVRFHQYGGPEVLQYEDAPDPVRGSGEVLVRVKACALNHLDIWQRIGPPRVKVNLPHISGSDISGVVEEVPAGEMDLQKGAEVIVNPGIGCGRCEKCLSGKDNQCRYYGIVGSEFDGGYAELVSIPRRNVLQKPERMDFVQAASVPLVFLTAYHMLVKKAALEPGETVLVLGAGSGVGVAGYPDSQGVRCECCGHRGHGCEAAQGSGAWRRQCREPQHPGYRPGGQEVHRGQGSGRGGGARRKGHVGQEYKVGRKGRADSDLRGHDRFRCRDGSPLRLQQGDLDLRQLHGWGRRAAQGPGAIQAAEAATGCRQGVSAAKRGGRPGPDGEGRALRQDRA